MISRQIQNNEDLIDTDHLIKLENIIPSSKIREDQMPADNHFLCFNISKLSNRAQFFLCSFGVFFFFIIYGYLQELIFTLKEFKPYGWYLTFIQFIYYAIFGLIETQLRRDVHRKIPLKIYIFLALLTVGTMGFSNASLGHLNYPTQVIFKCCKLIPVLVGSTLIQGKKYSPLDYLAAAIMCYGLILFILADSKISPIFDLIGIFMISCALLCDAVIGNVQEKTMKKHKASNAEVVLYSYSIGIFYILLYLLISGDFFPAFNICLEYKMETYGYGFLFSLTGYIGIQIVLQLVRTSGAFLAVTVTTMRKAITIILSFIVFQKPFTFQYVYSGLLVVFGIYLNIYSKNNPNFKFIHFLKKIVRFFKRKPQKSVYQEFSQEEV